MERIEIYEALPPEALAIRHEVFEVEQGLFDPEGAEDALALHLLLWEEDSPIATCRILKTEREGEYLLGRIAVVKSQRGRGVGGRLLAYAEEHLCTLGATEAVIHAQCTAEPFYKRCGYLPEGEVTYTQGRAHISMRKHLGS